MSDDAAERPMQSAAVVQRELREFARSHEQRRRQLPRALLVGLIAGMTAVAFRGALRQADQWRNALFAFAHAHPRWAWVIPLLVGACGGGYAVYLVRRLAPEAAGSGIPHVKAVLHGTRVMRRRVLPVKFVGGVAGIGTGLAMGREGPTIQMGAAIGQMVAGWFPSTPRERRTLIAAGAGAGLAGAFNAPLAGVVFVLEELQRDFSPAVFTATFIAAAVADVTTRSLLGQLPVFHVATYAIPPLAALPAALILGGAAGVAGVAFNRSLLWTSGRFQDIRQWPPWVTGAMVGVGVSAVGLFVPGVLGGGDRLVDAILAGDVTLAALAGFMLLRFVLTMVSYGSGAPGGIFAPLLVLGAGLGLAAGQIAAALAPAAVEHPESFAIVGMAAYFTAIVRAPLTAVVLMVEMTGNYGLVLPLLTASLAAYGVADWLGDRPVYEALLERDMLRSQEAPHLDANLLLDLTIAAGSPLDGAVFEDVSLPTGTVVVLRRRGLHEHVPTPSMQLAAGDTITALVSAEAAASVPELRRLAGLL